MGRVSDYSDERLTASCIYCGGLIKSREHVPSKILLDEPLPMDLPIVGTCQPCNEGFSADEEYLACLIDCAIVGHTEPNDRHRPKIARKLEAQPALRKRIERSRLALASETRFMPEMERVQRVLRKLAQGHVLYELSESVRHEPVEATVRPLVTMSAAQVQAFEYIGQPSIWPEVGSRMMTRVATGDTGWQIVQPARYRYAVIYGGPTTARIVLSEYLACEFVWDD